MSEPSQAVAIPADLAIVGAPSMFETNTANISGGVFTVIGVQNNTVNIVHGTEEPQNTVEEVLAMLQTCIEVDPWAVHDAIQGNKTPDSGMTFISRADIHQWIDRVRSVFWLKGGPGTGKTYLVSTLFDQLYKASKNSDSAAGIAYLQFNAQMSEREIVMVLIMHLVKCSPLPAVLDYIRVAFSEFPLQGRAERPTPSQLWTILGHVVKKYRRCYIFIDGLDEMREEVREMLIRMLAALEANILIASRDLTALEEMLAELRGQPLVTVEVTAEEQDLDLYIEQVIKESGRLTRILSRVPGRRVELVTIVKTNSKGMFLHVKLQMEALRHCLSIRELFEAIQEIPEGIRALYSETLKRIERQPGRQGERAKQALIWILHARRSLSIEELQHTMAAIPPDYDIDIDSVPSKEDLLMICCGLLSIDNFSNVGFLHLSAQEILPDLLSLTFPAPQTTLALTCISVLGVLQQAAHLATLKDLKEEFSNTPLLEYAYNSGADHFRQAIEESPEFESTITAFICSCQSFPYHHPLSTGIQHLGPLHVACMFGLPSIVKDLLSRSPDDQSNARATMASTVWSCLMIAGGAGQSEVVQVILDFFAGCTSDTAAFGMKTLLAEGMECHDDFVLEALLDRVQLPRTTGSQPPGSPEIAPGDEAHLDPELLATAGTDEARSLELIRASGNGHLDTVAELLATPGVDPNFRTEDGTSALMQASYWGYTEVVKLLLAVSGVDVNLCDKSGDSALMQASYWGHTDVVKLLLAVSGVDLNLCNKNGDSALMQASNSSWAHIEIVMLLLAVPGADLNLCDKNGDTALMQASRRGGTEVVNLLLAVPGVELNLCNKDGHSAFMHASRKGRTAIVELLLAVPGVDINLCDNSGDSALMQASWWGRTDVVKLLLATPGIDLDIRNTNGDSVLELASRACMNSEAIVELLKAHQSEGSH